MFCPGATVAGPVFVTARSAVCAAPPPELMVMASDARLLAGFGSTVLLVMMASSISTVPDGVAEYDTYFGWNVAVAPAARIGILHSVVRALIPHCQPAGVGPISVIS